MGRILYIPARKYRPIIKYGLLYNWYAATDARNIAASGWVVPSSTECNILKNYLGGTNVAGGHLKADGTTYWEYDYADNSSGFNAVGAGERSSGNGIFTNLRVTCYFIASTNYDTTTYLGGGVLQADATSLVGVGSLDAKKRGASIRLLKSTTTLSNGQSGLYTGNDGKVYRTICIGTQEWLADNLAETKYRNGDSIPEVTDNSAWAALTSGAMCAYGNDWNNV